MRAKVGPVAADGGMERQTNRFRYVVLPDALAPFRVALERMLIRELAALFENKRGVATLAVPGAATRKRSD